MEREEKLSILERSIRTELNLKFDDVERKVTDSGFIFKLKTMQGIKMLTITKYLLDDRDFGDVRFYVIDTVSQINSTDTLELTTKSIDEFYDQ